MKTKNIYFSIVIVAIVLLLSLYQWLRNRMILSSDLKYVVGTVYEVRKPTKGDHVILYEFVFNNVRYKRKQSDWFSYEIEDRFVVAIAIEYDNRPFLFLDYQVPEGFESPANSWEEIPKEIIEHNRLK